MAEWLSLAEAIAAHVHDGETIAMEGFTHLIPFAAGHEIIRQRRRNLSLVRMTPDVIYDQLIGAGCAAKLTFSWAGIPASGPCTAFAMPWKMAGPGRLRSRSAATAIWRMRMWREQPTCPSRFCGDIQVQTIRG